MGDKYAVSFYFWQVIWTQTDSIIHRSHDVN